MKRSSLPLAAGLCLCLVLGACAHAPVFPESGNALNLAEMTDQDYQRLAADIQAGKAVVIRVDPGTTLPVKASMDLPFAAIEPETLSLQIRQQMYIGITQNGLWMSPDGRIWNPVQDLARIKQAFGMGPGEVSVGFAASKETGPYVNLRVEGKAGN
ncbi:MAG: hypothetical protein AB1921_05285 [Thermodesulfobacteriota bacterium]